MKKEKKSKRSGTIEDFARKELGQIFRRERERRHLSQEEVAKRIGKSKTAVVYYESGERPIHFAKFVRFCSALRVSPGFILNKWMEEDTFRVLDDQRKKEYHDVVDEMIKYGFSAELDNLLVYYRGLINREKEIRERIRQKEKIQKEYQALQDLHQYKGEKGGNQGENGV